MLDDGPDFEFGLDKPGMMRTEKEVEQDHRWATTPRRADEGGVDNGRCCGCKCSPCGEDSRCCPCHIIGRPDEGGEA